MPFRRVSRMLACPILMAVSAGSAPSTSVPLPGAPAFEDSLSAKLKKALAARGRLYKPRTRHLEPDGFPRFTNRLILESSPYLLQHAHNPVNWYPWGDEAFAAARRLGRPVLLSVGYSTCHWCHVMEEESFEDLEIARYLNENYVAIKVDREERPDIDAIYMSAVQAMNGSGGWPMTVWLDSARKPFFGGAYFPPRDGDRGVARGFLTLLGMMKKIYSAEPGTVAQSSTALLEAMAETTRRPKPGEALQAGTLARAAQLYKSQFDSDYGGLRGTPKFPSGFPVRFLLRYHRRTGDPEMLRMAVLTLEKMAAGGIRDHVGGGFHRYSTDASWLTPHFEKMLYDNALLAMDYLEGSQAAGNAALAAVAREILDYVGRDMTSPEGAFYSATDADSPDPSGRRKEGWYFTWTPAEMEAVLGRDRASAAVAYYGVTGEGNFEGRNILHTPRPLGEVAAELGIAPGTLRRLLDESNAALLAARSRRPPPLRDEKILTSWNGLMISAFARASLALGEPAYLKRAERAASFILDRMRRGGRLLRSYQQGTARHNAYLDDYAFLAAGLLDLYEASGDPRCLRDALSLDAVLESHFEDKSGGGFYLTSDDHERLIAREKPAYDGAEPSGNSVAVMNLLRLAEFTGSDRFRQRAGRALEWFRGQIGASPSSLSEMLLALDFSLDRPKEIVIVTPRSRDEAEPFLARLRAAYVPNRVLAVVPEGAPLRALAKLVPLVEGKTARNGAATAYVCEKGICELPATDPGVFATQIGKVEKLDSPLPEKRGP